MISRFFIQRPILSVVASLLFVIAGAVSIAILPIDRYPEITPPTVEIRASYPGADAQTVAESVATPIEQQLAGAEGLLYYQSMNSNDGSCKITVTFEIGTDQDLAAIEVQNRLSIAEPTLPQEVVRQGISVVKVSSNILGVVALESTDQRHDDVFLANYAKINMVDRLKRVDGVGDATVFGSRDYAMRIWLDPDKLTARGLTVSDVTRKLRDQNAVFPAGALGQRPVEGKVELRLPLLTRGRLETPEQFEQIVLRAEPNGARLRLGDVARVELGAQGYNLLGRLNGEPTTLMLITLQTGANALETMDGVRAEMARSQAGFPEGMSWRIPYDTTLFVRDSVSEVVTTLLEAVVLVILIVFVFLQSWRATLIPLLAVPVAVIGTFAGMLALGFSINALTLFGLVLAIGIVVDDAIIVVENVERLMHEEGLAVAEATIKAMEQVTGPVIAIVLVLSAVFVPVAFLGGLTGQLYRQFAITIAVSVGISGFVALTLSPALCRLLLRPSHGEKNVLFRGFDRAFGWLTEGYVAGVRTGIKLLAVTLVLFGALCWGTWRLQQAVPGGFLPTEDQGYAIGVVLLPDGASLDRTQAVLAKAEEFYSKHPAVGNVVTLGGYDILAGGAASSNAGVMFLPLKPFSARKGPGMAASDVIAAGKALFGIVDDGLVLTINPPPIRGLGQRAGFTVQVEQRGGGTPTELAQAVQAFQAELTKRGLLGLNSTMRVASPQMFLDLDREKAQILGVQLASVFEPLQAYYGSLYVNDFNRFGRIWRVMAQAEPRFRTSPRDVGRIYARSDVGSMVPLSAILTPELRVGPNLLPRFNGYPAVEVTGAPAEGMSSGAAIELVQEVASETLPQGYAIEFSGASYQEIKAGNQAPIVLGFGLLIVFLILAAQYERWSLPLAVLLGIPIAILGALAAVLARGYAQDIYFQVGLLVLVGLAAKNAILIVEFCAELRAQGVAVVDAAIQAARLRFRPIVMTSLAFVLGVVPLAIAQGAGAGGRRSIGTGVIGGMLASTFLAVFFVPAFYVLIQRISERLSGGAPDQPGT